MYCKKPLLICMAILLLFSSLSTVYAAKDRATMATKLLAFCYQARNLYKNLDKFVLPKGEKYVSLTPVFSSVGGSECFGYILEMPKKIYIVFRGSESYSDIVKDFIMWKAPFSYIPNGGNVHSGFLSIYEGTSPLQPISLREQIFNTLQTLNPDKQLIVTGFSLGGALATLCACDVVENSQFKDPIVYTFASPRVGDQQFVDTFNGKIRESVRIINYYDYVPCNPMQYLGYQHVKGEVVLSVNRGRIDRNHRMTEAYFPGLVANVPEYLESKLKKKDPDLCPPLPETLPQPSWEDKERNSQTLNNEQPKQDPSPEEITTK